MTRDGVSASIERDVYLLLVANRAATLIFFRHGAGKGELAMLLAVFEATCVDVAAALLGECALAVGQIVLPLAVVDVAARGVSHLAKAMLQAVVEASEVFVAVEVDEVSTTVILLGMC